MDIVLPHSGFVPRPEQMGMFRAMIDPKIKTVAVCASRRAGKDETALHATVINAMHRVGAYVYAVPLASQVRAILIDGVSEVSGKNRISQVFPDELIERFDRQSMRIFLKNGSVIFFIGSDNFEGILGLGAVGMVNSEAALANPSFTAFMRPMLTASDGKDIHISTPRGKNFFWKTIQEAKGRTNAYTEIIDATMLTGYKPEKLAETLNYYIQLYGSAAGNALFNQEYMCSFSVHMVGAVWGEELANLKAEGRYAKCGYDKRYGVTCAADIGWNDDTVIVYSQMVGREIRIIDVTIANKHDVSYYVQKMKEKNYVYDALYLPHDSMHHTVGAGAQSVFAQFKSFGFNCKLIPKTDKKVQIALGAQLLNRCIINAETNLDDGEPKLEQFWDSINSYRFEYDEEKKINSLKPVHDKNSHCADALMYLACATSSKNSYVQPSIELKHATPTNNMRLRDIQARHASSHSAGGAWG